MQGKGRVHVRVLDQLGGGATNPKEFAALDETQREENRQEWKKAAGCGEEGEEVVVVVVVVVVVERRDRLFGHSRGFLAIR